ncbi:hypothetical protein [Marinobacter shengliensis]|uniref:hypothetical protein n=1 Tax=Marinobacter shengliensis TaxID=1389223 RepID=UPI00257252EF|nr:hypothetical protein [Marinobacter shengliensis]BEH14282.1 hypothetical protein MAALD49_16500 [Marinobacter shengliensis]
MSNDFEDLKVELAALEGAYVLLVRYLAQDGQVHIDELCEDLDAMCQSQPDPAWQRRLMVLTESLRGVDDRLRKDLE